MVLAPYLSTTGAAISLVKHHREWIIDKLSHYQAKHIDTQKKYIPGDTVFYLGRPYTLKTGSGSSIKLSTDQLLVPALPPATVQKRLEAWYKLRAADIFLDRLTLYEPKVGHQHNKLRLSSAKSRWGSCSTTGTISLRWTLIMAPLSVLDYVVVHELCHLVHMNHSRSFWKLVKTICPDMNDAVHWLKSNGHTLALPKP